jgi:hypothetical protein
MLLARDLPGELNRLHVVHCADLTPLSMTHPRHTARLAEWILAERCIRHPLLVCSLPEITVVLDGNSRLAAAHRLELPDILVQTLPPEFLPDPLRLPAMLVSGVTREEVERVLDPAFARVEAPPPEALVVHLPGGETRALIADGIHVCRVWDSYRLIITALQTSADVAPLSGTAAGLLASGLEAHSVLIVPPPLPTAVMKRLALQGTPLPWGALQAPFPRRILGINLSLAVLRAPEPPEEKTDFVRELVRLRLSERKVHLYDAPVYLFEP